MGLTSSKPLNNPYLPAQLAKTSGVARPIEVVWGMKQAELACELAREARLPPAEAKDRIDELVHGIVKKLRRGRPVKLPGLGKLVKRAMAQKKR